MKLQHKHKKCLSLLMVMMMSLPSWTWAEDKTEKEEPALGVATEFGDVLIENLGIGRTYNLRALAGKPLAVKNNSTMVVDLKISVETPTETMITRKRKNLGVEPIPSLAWVSVSQEDFILPPGESAFTDVILKIPDDPSLYGKKFQASIHSRTVGQNFLQLGVWSHVIFYIIDSPEKQAEMEKNRKRGLDKQADYSLLPDKIYIENVPIGKKFDVRKMNKRTIKLANSGEDEFKVSVKQVQIADSPLSPQHGFAEGQFSWLKFKSEEYLLEVDSFVDPGWVFELPNDPSLKGKKYMFVFKVEPVGENITGYTFYGRFYIEVEK